MNHSRLGDVEHVLGRRSAAQFLRSGSQSFTSGDTAGYTANVAIIDPKRRRE